MLPNEDLDANPSDHHVLASGLDLFAPPKPYDPLATCEICGRRWDPGAKNIEKTFICSNPCRMKAKKRRKREGWKRPKTPMPHQPWTYVRKRTECSTSTPPTPSSSGDSLYSPSVPLDSPG